MTQKLHEELNRIRKLSGLVEDDKTWSETLPDGTVRTHRYGYSDEKPGYNGYRDLRGWGDTTGTGPSNGPGPGSGSFGNGPGSGATGNGTGSGANGNGFGQGNSQGSGRQGTGAGNGYGQTQGLPGGGAGTSIQRLPGGGTVTTTTTGGYPGEYSSGDYSSDYSDEPVDPRQAARDRAEQRRQDAQDRAEQRQQDAQDAREAAAQARQDRLDAIAAQKAAKQAPTQQLTPDPTVPKQVKTLPQQQTTPDTPVVPKQVKTLPQQQPAEPTSIAKDILLPQKQVKTLPTTPTPITPQTISAPVSNEPSWADKKVKTLPPVANVNPVPSSTVSTVAPEKKIKELPQVITPTHPGMTVDVKTPDSKPVTPAADLPTFKQPTTVKQFPNAAAVIPKTLSTTEPSTWDIPTPGEKPAEPAKSVPAPDSSVPTQSVTDKEWEKMLHPDTTSKPSTPTGSVSVAKDLLLPQEPPADTKSQPRLPSEPIEVELISPQEFDARTNNQSANIPRPPNPSSKPSAAGAGSGSPGDSASGASGASGEKGGGAKGKPYIPITSKTMSAPVSDQPSWAAQQRNAQGKPMAGDPEIKKPENITGAQGSIQPPSDANADIIAKGNKATINMTPADAAKAKTNVFKPDSPGPESPSDNITPDDGPRMLDIKGPGNKSNEGMERMLQLAGIKESTKVERQFLQESKANKLSNIADTFKRLAGLK